MKHELWVESQDEQTFCLAGKHGEYALRSLGPNARLAWACEASSHFEAMTMYFECMGWGEYQSEYPEQDKRTYIELGWE